jgi:hypothetical protein
VEQLKEKSKRYQTKLPLIGKMMTDGSLYAGTSPDTGKAMFTTPEDAAGRTLAWEVAMALAAKLDAHGYRDWRVPTKGELDVLFRLRSAVGGFKTSGANAARWYWSSSQEIDGTVWGQHFSDGLQINYGKLVNSSLRCVRG